jgi:hypothetical protein
VTPRLEERYQKAVENISTISDIPQARAVVRDLVGEITAVPLTKIRHAGLDPVSSKSLINLDSILWSVNGASMHHFSGSAKNAVRNDGTLF